jgi:ribonuclease VapC
VIVVDSSALVAVLLEEDDAPRFASLLLVAPLAMSAFTLFETRTVLWRSRDPTLVEELEDFVGDLTIALYPFDDRASELAFAAYRTFGKGTHPAKLNLGDCASYALAKSLDAPLLYKGGDFAQTDVRSALAP